MGMSVPFQIFVWHGHSHFDYWLISNPCIASFSPDFWLLGKLLRKALRGAKHIPHGVGEEHYTINK